MTAPGAARFAEAVRWVALILCSLLGLGCASPPNTNRFIVVAEPGEVQTWQEFCDRACAARVPAGRKLVDCYAVSLAPEIVEKLNHPKNNGAVCELR